MRAQPHRRIARRDVPRERPAGVAVGRAARALLAAGCLCAAEVARAQADPRDFTIGGMIAGNLTDAFQSARAAAASKRLAEQDIEAARERYWAAYPRGAGFKEAAAALAEQLFAKDYYYLQLAWSTRIDRAITGGRKGDYGALLDRLTGGTVDGGIPRAARPAFETWVDSAVASATVRMLGLPMLTPEAVASPRSVAAYRAYMAVRDQEEFLRGPYGQTASARASRARSGTPLAAPAAREPEAAVEVVAEVEPSTTQQVLPVRADWGALAAPEYLPDTERDAIAQHVAQLGAAGQRLLECRYPPAEPGAQPEATYYYWHAAVGASAGELRKISNYHPLLALGDRAFEACEPTAADAARQREAGFGLALPQP